MKINKKDAPLHVDVSCFACGKNMALSNAYQHDGRYYCQVHYNMLVVNEPWMKELTDAKTRRPGTKS